MEPRRIRQQVLEQKREALGDGVVAEEPLLGRKSRVGEGEVLGVARLVEEGLVVVLAALRQDDEDDAAGYADRRAERTRALARPGLDVELDVPLGVEVDPQPRERRAKCRQGALGDEACVELGRAPQPCEVGEGGILEPDADPPAQGRVDLLAVERVGLGRERAVSRSTPRGS